MLSINVGVNHQWAFPSWHMQCPGSLHRQLPPGREAQQLHSTFCFFWDPGSCILGRSETAERASAQTMTQPQRDGCSPFQRPLGERPSQTCYVSKHPLSIVTLGVPAVPGHGPPCQSQPTPRNAAQECHGQGLCAAGILCKSSTST